MIIPVYMDESDMTRTPRTPYYAAADLEWFQTELRSGAEKAKDPKTSAKSVETVDYYCAQLKRLTEIVGHDVEWMLSNSTLATELLLGAKRRDRRSMIDEWSTLRGLVMGVLAVYKYVPSARDRWPEGQRVWSAVLTERINPEARRKDESSELSEQQKDGWVEWADVQKKTRELLRTQPTSVEALLLAIYTMRAGVARADFGDLRIYRPPHDPVPTDVQGSPNYIEWRTGRPMVLHLNAYKTAKHQKDPEVTDELSAELTAVIASSLQERPRKWLFVQPSSGEPYDGRAFSKMACRALRRVFGKPVTLQVLRRSGVTALDMSKLTEGERGVIARVGYQHDRDRQMKYRVVHTAKRDQGADRTDAAKKLQTEKDMRNRDRRARETAQRSEKNKFSS